MESGIQVPLTRNLQPRNPQPGIQNPRLPWISLRGLTFCKEEKTKSLAVRYNTLRPGQNSGVITRDDHQSRKKPQHLYERITFSEISFHFSTIQWIGWPKVVTLGAFPGSQFFETQKLWKKKRKKRRSFCNYPQVRISSHLDFLYSLSISFKCFSFRVVFRIVNI